MPGHVALLGDSIFDNGQYTRGEPDVAGHLRSIVPRTWRVTLLAVDGTWTGDFAPQLGRVPDDATHIVLSLGGNDALLNADVLATPVKSSTEALALLADRYERFASAYRTAVDAVVGLGRRTTLCTIYYGNLGPDEARIARIALMPFNEAIMHVAVECHLDVIDLRLVCTDPSHYANPIEPSGLGGRRIATAIAHAVGAIAGGRT